MLHYQKNVISRYEGFNFDPDFFGCCTLPMSLLRPIFVTKTSRIKKFIILKQKFLCLFKRCAPLKVGPRKELLAFQMNYQNYRSYPNQTTIAIFANQYNSEILCSAHSRNIRVVCNGYFAKSILMDPQEQDRWVREKLEFVKNNFLDGLNIDFEDEMFANETQNVAALNSFTSKIANAFKVANEYYQVSFDFRWAPGGGRFYDYAAIAKSLDFAVIMSYDLRAGTSTTYFRLFSFIRLSRFLTQATILLVSQERTLL